MAISTLQNSFEHVVCDYNNNQYYCWWLEFLRTCYFYMWPLHCFEMQTSNEEGFHSMYKLACIISTLLYGQRMKISDPLIACQQEFDYLCLTMSLGWKQQPSSGALFIVRAFWTCLKRTVPVSLARVHMETRRPYVQSCQDDSVTEWMDPNIASCIVFLVNKCTGTQEGPLLITILLALVLTPVCWLIFKMRKPKGMRLKNLGKRSLVSLHFRMISLLNWTRDYI